MRREQLLSICGHGHAELAVHRQCMGAHGPGEHQHRLRGRRLERRLERGRAPTLDPE
jgi:hypothetical protein